MPAGRQTWPWRLGIAAVSAGCALALTHLFWRFLQHTPFMLGFGAAILSSRLGGRAAGFLAVGIGLFGYALFPPPLPDEGLGRLLLGFAVVSGAFSWLVARRYEIEAELRSSEARLGEAQALAHVGNWQWDVAGNRLWWSDELYRIFGVDRASFQLSYAAFLQIIHPDDRPIIEGAVRRAVQERQPYEVEHRIVRPDGEIRVIHGQGRVVLDEHGKVIRMVGATQDITERKAAEDIVSRSERRLQTVIDAEPACVKLVSPDGILLDMNRAGLEMVGASDVSQIVGRLVIDLVHPDDRTTFLEMHRAALSGSPGRREFRIVGLNGEERWVDSHAVPFDTSTDKGETQPAVLSVTSDISERIRAQRAFHEAEERMRFALEASQLGVWDANLKTGVSYWSETCEVLHGLERGTFGKSFSAFIERIHPEDREAVLQAIDEAVREHRRSAEIEYRTLWPDGTEHRISSSAHFFYDDAGVPLRGAGVSTDVTEKRSLEAQLRQSQKMEAIGMLAGGIAHDFNNLLTAISGYTELVIDTLDDEDTRREDLQEVAKAAQRAAALTRQLLAVSRRQVLQPTVLDVNGMVADLQKLLHRTIPESIDFQLALGPVDAVRADRGGLEQVVLNLAINAGDAMPQGGHLRLATATVDIDEAWARRHAPMPAGRYVRLTVSDTGVGMPREIQARIFEPFFTTKERGKGTGLGLATVYGIVKQSGGFIWVESEVGRGTTFEVYLPVVHEPIAPAVLMSPVEEISGGTQTILLAEDDGVVRRLARDVLTKQGYTVLDARDGDEALETARRYRGPIHLLIADVVMPGLSGRDLAERLAAERPTVRVLYTSGYTENLMMRAGFEHGLALLAKPFLPVDLVRAVRQVLDASNART